MNISPDVLLDQYQRARRLWPFFAAVEDRFDLPPFLLYAIGSKETNLQPEYAAGKVHADGHGWGLFGADDRWNVLDLPGFASDPHAQAERAAATLAFNYRTHDDWLDAVNAYGPASGRPAYGADVLERRQFLADLTGEQPVPTPVAIILAATAHLAELGYDVTFEPGWQDRGRPGAFEPQGLVCHHTADRAYGSDYAILSAIRDGIDQGGSWLAGPLAQFGLGRSGTVYVVAAGKANHAGPGGWGLLSGNGTVWGIEAANDGIGEPWPAEQLDAYLALATALARFTGFGPESVCRHAEWSTAGKIDTATAPLNSGAWIRAQVAERLAEPPDPTPVPKEDDMASPFVLLTYGSGVALWHPSGDVVPLASAKQVTDALTRGDVVMDDLTDEQVERITGAKVALTAGPALAELVRAARGEQEPLGCAEAD